MQEYKHDIISSFLLITLFVVLTFYFIIFSIPLIILGVITRKKYIVKYADNITDMFIKD